jgi:hypothetical protein
MAHEVFLQLRSKLRGLLFKYTYLLSIYFLCVIYLIRPNWLAFPGVKVSLYLDL